MYIGQYKHTIDSKNRLFLPSGFRGKNDVFILTQGLEGCVYLYDMAYWKKVLEKLDSLSLSDKVEERAFKRLLLSGAFKTSLDFQGRILMPKNLKEYAKIKSEVIIIGVGNRAELWDIRRWSKYYKQKANISFRKIAGKLEI